VLPRHCGCRAVSGPPGDVATTASTSAARTGTLVHPTPGCGRRTVSALPGDAAAAASTNATPPSPTLTLPRPSRSAAPGPTSRAASCAPSADLPSYRWQASSGGVKLWACGWVRGWVCGYLPPCTTKQTEQAPWPADSVPWRATASGRPAGTANLEPRHFSDWRAAPAPGLKPSAWAQRQGQHGAGRGPWQRSRRHWHAAAGRRPQGAPARAPAAARWARRRHPVRGGRRRAPTAPRPPRTRPHAAGRRRCCRARPRLRGRGRRAQPPRRSVSASAASLLRPICCPHAGCTGHIRRVTRYATPLACTGTLPEPHCICLWRGRLRFLL